MQKKIWTLEDPEKKNVSMPELEIHMKQTLQVSCGLTQSIQQNEDIEIKWEFKGKSSIFKTFCRKSVNSDWINLRTSFLKTKWELISNTC